MAGTRDDAAEPDNKQGIHGHWQTIIYEKNI